MLEVGLDYPDELHNLHNYYPLVVEIIKVREEMLPEYQLQIIQDKMFSLDKNKKIILNLDNKRKYKIYYQNLKLYLNLGLQSKKNHEILEFNQKPFLKPCIEHDTDL